MTLHGSDEAARRLAAIVSSSDDAIVSKDLNGIVQTWNAAAERLFGFSEAEIIGKSILTIIPPNRHHEEEGVLSRIRRGERVEHFETVRQRKDGTLIPVSLTVSPLFAADGSIIGASKIARDISERRRSDETLVRLEADRADLQRRLLALVGASQSIVGKRTVPEVLDATMKLAVDLVGADGYVVWRQAEEGRWIPARFKGVSQEFIDIGAPKKDGQPIPPPRRELVVSDVYAEPFLAPRAPAYRKEGIHSLLLIPLKLYDRVTGSLVFYYRDPHTFSDVEVQAALALGNLAGAGISAAELQEQERSSREEARQANLIKDQFLATLSHELRTPLNAMVGYARMLLRGAVEPERHSKALSVIERNGTVLSQIVEDLLDVSRIASGKLTIKPAQLELRPLVQQATETLLPTAESRGVTLALSGELPELVVMGDVNRLQQVVWNLVSNALKFTPAGGTVTVCLRREDATARLEVNDTGIGIPPRFLPLVFEPFRQADGHSREQGGLGLGLAITRRLVEMHGGTISATSEGEGHGATFVVLLPLVDGRQ